MVPVDVPEHLILREEEGLEGGEALLRDRDLQRARPLLPSQREGLEQPVHVDGSIRHPAEEAVPPQIVDLVEIQGAGDQPLQGVAGSPLDELGDHLGRFLVDAPQRVPDRVGLQELRRHLFVVARDRSGAHLLHRVREGVVPHIVEKGSEQDDRQLSALLRADPLQRAAPAQAGDGAAGEPVHADRVVEARVDRARIHQMREAQLLDPPQPLEIRGVDDLGGNSVEPDVVPDRIPERATMSVVRCLHHAGRIMPG